MVTFGKSPFFLQKPPFFLQKSPLFLQMSPLFLQKHLKCHHFFYTIILNVTILFTNVTIILPKQKLPCAVKIKKNTEIEINYLLINIKKYMI